MTERSKENLYRCLFQIIICLVTTFMVYNANKSIIDAIDNAETHVAGEYVSRDTYTNASGNILYEIEVRLPDGNLYEVRNVHKNTYNSKIGSNLNFNVGAYEYNHSVFWIALLLTVINIIYGCKHID